MKLWRGEPSHSHWKRPFSAGEQAMAAWGLAGFCGAFALVNAMQPRQAPFSGRFSALFNWAHAQFGPQGPALVWLAAALLLALVGLGLKRRG